MGKKIIDIDGFIGAGGYSAQYVKNALREAKDDDVEVHINSLGGDVAHAIAIKDALQAHGNVTAVYSGMSASSATLISLGCKAVKMTKDSFYLIHKPMTYVDAWGVMNEDELKQFIEKLDMDLENTQKITLQMAKMYAEKSGFSIKSVLDLMKKESWLTAEEALKWNFVDTLTDPVNVTNYAEDLKMVALLAGNDLPPLPRKTAGAGSGSAAATGEEIIEKFRITGESFLEKMKNMFSNHKNRNTEMSKSKAFAMLCTLLAVEAIEMTDDGVFLNKEQMDKIEARLKQLGDEKTTAESNLTAAKTAKETAENSLSAALTAMDDLDATVKAAADPKAKVEAIRKKLAEKPGSAATGHQTKSDSERKREACTDMVDEYVNEIL
jgi:ATP-dependent protease ClpP protease subunit